MGKFINDFVDFYLKDRTELLDDSIIIVPSKRSVSALRYAFAAKANTIWLPEITDIVSFIERISNLEVLDHQQTILEFYKIYKIHTPQKDIDDFETFYSWASVLIGDFNELDRFLVDTSTFFEHYKALKTLNYFGVEKTDIIKSYIKFWEDLPMYYSKFKTNLLNQHQAYQGLAYRYAVQNIDVFLKREASRPFYFVGFNALNKAEEFIIEQCLKQVNTRICWDLDDSFLKDKYHPAGLFIRNYQELWDNYNSSFIKLKQNDYTSEKHISIESTPKSIGQAKSISHILNNLTEDEIEKTAIVLNDENLLQPILNSIPESIKDVNITMGIPLSQSPLIDFFLSIIIHQKNRKDKLHYNDLRQMFSHSLLEVLDEKLFTQIANFFNNNSFKTLGYEALKTRMSHIPKIQIAVDCFQIFEKPLEFLNYLLNFTDDLAHLHQGIYQQYLQAFYHVLLDTKKLFESNSALDFSALSIIIRDKIEKEKLSFKGSKTEGLQVMGMLETRLLDFENIILTSVNEGVIPSGKTDNSYITYNLKKTYNLPTHTEKDAIYAYHFFRLMQRAKKCFILYDSDQTGFNKGEPSRFISHLNIFKTPSHQTIKKQFSLSTQLVPSKEIEIEKTPAIISQLNKLAESGFSPTALTTYINNPILFYKRYILRVKENEVLDSVVNHKDFGTIVHNTIEDFYTNIGELSEDNINIFKSILDETLKRNFDKIYLKDSYISGANKIQYESAKAYITRFLEKEVQDLKRSNIKIENIEEDINMIFKSQKNKVKLKGKIDRIDLHNGDVRIIDLKTGKVNPADLNFTNIEDVVSDYKYAKAFQILLYSYVYSKKHNIQNLKAGIISFKNLNNWFIPLRYNKSLNIDESILLEFEVYLGQLIDEILDPKTSFIEKASIYV